MQTFIKFFFISICCIFTYSRLLNVEYKKSLLFAPTFSILIGLLAYHVHRYIAPLTLIITVLCLILFLFFTFNQSLNTTFMYATISFCISYICFFISLIITSPVNCAIYAYSGAYCFISIINALLLGITQFVLLQFLFRVKRFKQGIPFLSNRLQISIGTFISIFIILLSSLFYVEINSRAQFISLIFLVIFCGLIIIFWWRSIISNSYLEKLHERDIERYESELSDKQAEINELKTQNAELSKIIHKDNKLIPAMNLAVHEIIDSSADKNDLNEHAKSIINQLDELAKERKGIIHDYESSNRKLQKTGVASVDALLKYLYNRACQLNINFDILLMCDIKYLTENIISENDFNTIVADLGENAIIAVSQVDHPNVLISFCIENGHYKADFYDNAQAFAPEVLSLFGKERITTHKESGGSGIGLMTVCELLKKYNASFELDETIKFEGYTKRVSVCFDEKADFRTDTVAGSNVSSIDRLQN